MKPCKTVGLDVTWRCNWDCQHCYYRHNANLHTAQDVPLEKLLAKVDQGRAGGCDKVVLEGWGEPTLYPQLGELLTACRDRGMATSIITNGAVNLDTYKRCYLEWGLDHLLISSHGVGETLDMVAERKKAGERQLRLKEWLRDEGLPFRTNFVLMEQNHRNCPETVRQDVELGSFMVNLIGFQAHYEWRDPSRSTGTACDPAKLRPYIEEAGEITLAAGRLFTIRYHPMCHLSPKFWPHLVNARYVFMDPWEWNYQLQANDIPKLLAESKRMGLNTAIQDPCFRCKARDHCGCWNKNVASVLKATLIPVEEVPSDYTAVWETDGGLHDLNPANRLDGLAPPRTPPRRREEKAEAPMVETGLPAALPTESETPDFQHACESCSSHDTPDLAIVNNRLTPLNVVVGATEGHHS